MVNLEQIIEEAKRRAEPGEDITKHVVLNLAYELFPEEMAKTDEQVLRQGWLKQIALAMRKSDDVLKAQPMQMELGFRNLPRYTSLKVNGEEVLRQTVDMSELELRQAESRRGKQKVAIAHQEEAYGRAADFVASEKAATLREAIAKARARKGVA